MLKKLSNFTKNISFYNEKSMFFLSFTQMSGKSIKKLAARRQLHCRRRTLLNLQFNLNTNTKKELYLKMENEFWNELGIIANYSVFESALQMPISRNEIHLSLSGGTFNRNSSQSKCQRTI